MDIAQPPMHERPSPAPQHFLPIDPEALVRQALEKSPDATPHEISQIIKSHGHQVSGVWIAQMIRKFRDGE